MIISFCGTRPLCGKTTCSKYISEKFNANVVEFSKPISIMAKDLFGYNGNKENANQRKILQDFGLAAKKIEPHYWCWRVLACLYYQKNGIEVKLENLTEDSIRRFKWRLEKAGSEILFSKKKKLVLINGIRSKEEADFFKDYGAKIFLVSREILKRDIIYEHEVENQLRNYDRFDLIIDNNGTKQDLFNKLDKILESLNCLI